MQTMKFIIKENKYFFHLIGILLLNRSFSFRAQVYLAYFRVKVYLDSLLLSIVQLMLTLDSRDNNLASLIVTWCIPKILGG